MAVLRGGKGTEYEVSLKTGANVLATLGEKYDTQDIFIDRNGVWHMSGVPVYPETVCKNCDVVFNALHGEYGEDGQVQQILNHLGVPYTGSEAWASAMAMNKELTREKMREYGVKVPLGIVFDGGETLSEMAHTTFNKISPPWIVKPILGGSSVGMSVAKNSDELARALVHAFSFCHKVLVEEFITGIEATVGVVEDFRGQKHYALLPVQIIKPAHKDFFDYECKYDGSSQEICPGRFTNGESAELQELAVKVHNALNLRHYSRSDFIVHPKRGIFALEVNTLPGLTQESLLPKALHAVGHPLPEFLEHLIYLALKRK